jgi:hypothetical protein
MEAKVKERSERINRGVRTMVMITGPLVILTAGHLFSGAQTAMATSSAASPMQLAAAQKKKKRRRRRKK